MDSYSSSKNAVLAIITAGDCGHCKFFKQSGNIEKIKQSLSGSGIDCVHIEFSKMSSSTPDGYHQGIKSFVGWFPSFVLFNNTFYNKSSELKGLRYKAKQKEFVRGGKTIKTWVPASGFNPNDHGAIVAWTKKQASENSLFKGNSNTLIISEGDGNKFKVIPANGKLNTVFSHEKLPEFPDQYE